MSDNIVDLQDARIKRLRGLTASELADALLHAPYRYPLAHDNVVPFPGTTRHGGPTDGNRDTRTNRDTGDSDRRPVA